jgi:prophage regulatory protein
MQRSNAASPAPPLFIRRSLLKQVTGLSPSTVDRLERAGTFPSRRRVGPGVVGWLYSEVAAFLEQRERA